MPIHGNGGHAKVVRGLDFTDPHGWIIAVGDNAARRKEALAHPERCYTTAIHATAIVSPNATIGTGTVVMAGVIVQDDAIIGDHCILNSGCVVEHDCVIEDYVHIAPGVNLCGGVHIGEGALIGVGCNAIPQARVEPWTVVRGGSLIK